MLPLGSFAGAVPRQRVASLPGERLAKLSVFV